MHQLYSIESVYLAFAFCTKEIIMFEMIFIQEKSVKVTDCWIFEGETEPSESRYHF